MTKLSDTPFRILEALSGKTMNTAQLSQLLTIPQTGIESSLRGMIGRNQVVKLKGKERGPFRYRLKS